MKYSSELFQGFIFRKASGGKQEGLNCLKCVIKAHYFNFFSFPFFLATGG